MPEIEINRYSDGVISVFYMENKKDYMRRLGMRSASS